jgi:hypothetical protein
VNDFGGLESSTGVLAISCSWKMQPSQRLSWGALIIWAKNRVLLKPRLRPSPDAPATARIGAWKRLAWPLVRLLKRSIQGVQAHFRCISIVQLPTPPLSDAKTTSLTLQPTPLTPLRCCLTRLQSKTEAARATVGINAAPPYHSITLHLRASPGFTITIVALRIL